MIVLCRKPEHGDVPPGTVVSLADYPGLPEALEQLQLSFVPDVQAVLEGGSRSSTFAVMASDRRSACRS